jgi:hypothetical protein
MVDSPELNQRRRAARRTALVIAGVATGVFLLFILTRGVG